MKHLQENHGSNQTLNARLFYDHLMHKDNLNCAKAWMRKHGGTQVIRYNTSMVPVVWVVA